jgi:transposase
MDGRLYTLVRGEAFDSLDSVLSLPHFLPHVADKLLVIWDGSPIYKGDVRTFLAEGGAKQIHVEQLPAYAPDLNPGEGVWQHLKQVEIRNLCCRSLVHLRSEFDLAIKRPRRKPRLITACFAVAGLPIET